MRGLTPRFDFGIAAVSDKEIVMLGGRVFSGPLLGVYVFNTQKESLNRVSHKNSM